MMLTHFALLRVGRNQNVASWVGPGKTCGIGCLAKSKEWPSVPTPDMVSAE